MPTLVGHVLRSLEALKLKCEVFYETGTNRTRAKQDVGNIKTALKMYEVDMGSYPASLDDLLTNTGNSASWHGPYMDKQENQWKDPWEHEYIYHPPTGDGTDFQILSAGPDGQEGTGDDIK